jgi:hypothetical protein
MIYKTLHRRTDNNNGQKKTGKQWSTKHYKDVQTITMVNRKGQTMIYKTLQRRTDNNNGQKKKDKQWSTKHYTEN